MSDTATLEILAARDTRHRRVLGAAHAGEPPAAADWHLRACRFPEAWSRFGSPDRIDWRGLRAGLIDTGYTAHPALGFGSEAGSWVEARRAMSFVEPPKPGEASMLPDEREHGVDNMAGPSRGHGTRVASVLCGHEPGARGGDFLGAAPRLPLVPLRVADTTLLNDAQRAFAHALDQLVADGDVPIVLSGGGVYGTSLSRAFRRSIDDAYEAGMLLVCPAGDHINGLVAPARLGRCIAVAGTTVQGRPWAGSGYGPQVRLSAPATNIRRAMSFDHSELHDYDREGDGTAYAAALVAGAAALWLLTHREALDAAYPEPWQRVEAFGLLLERTARQAYPGEAADAKHGAGLLDVCALIDAPLPAADRLVKADPA